MAHGKGATFCPASREHCVQPSINATSLPVLCLLSSVLSSLQWINGTPVLPASQSHWFLPRGYKIMNRSVLLFFISIGGGYNKGFRLCFKGLFSFFLFVSLLKCFYWNCWCSVFFFFFFFSLPEVLRRSHSVKLSHHLQKLLRAGFGFIFKWQLWDQTSEQGERLCSRRHIMLNVTPLTEFSVWVFGIWLSCAVVSHWSKQICSPLIFTLRTLRTFHAVASFTSTRSFSHTCPTLG